MGEAVVAGYSPHTHTTFACFYVSLVPSQFRSLPLYFICFFPTLCKKRLKLMGLYLGTSKLQMLTGFSTISTISMASTVKSFSLFSPHFASDFERRARSRHSIRCLASRDSTDALSSDSVKVDAAVKGERDKGSVELGSGHVGSVVEEKKREKVKLEPLWDDGYGTETVKDYLDYARDMIKPDGGPVRWFTPISCGPHLRDSPVLFFLPGMDGLGLGLILHHKSLGRVFDVRCMHIPRQDRTPFEELVVWVEESLRAEHLSCPNKPVYLVGDSLGGCLALAVAARNPDIDLMVILANPATSFERSPLQLLLPLLEVMPDELHNAFPYLLGLIMGDPVKMATVNINMMSPTTQYFEQLAANLTAMLPRISSLADIIPKETMLWKLKQLKTGAAYVNSRLHAVKAEVLVLASGKDNMLPSKDEAWRLSKSLKNCNVKYFKDNGHTILLEDGINILTIIKGTSMYRRSSKYDYVMDFIPPSKSEFEKTRNGIYRLLRNYTGPVFLSTTEDGKMVRGLSGVPNEGPVLLVGYHMLMGFELTPLIEQFLLEEKILVRCLVHSTLFSEHLEPESKEFSFFNYVRLYGALPVSPSNLFKLFKTNSHVLLYPGGVREALHRKGEEYKLFWPDEPEFVRMAAKFGATIVPFGAIGEDDIAELVLDYDDLIKIPYVSDLIRRDNERHFNIRAGKSGEVANQTMYLPGMVPKIPGRLYYLFGKPIRMKGRQEMLKDREKARELYLEIKSEVETSLSYLLKKREEDPYRGIVDRTIYRAFHAPMDQVPTFEP